MKSKRKVTKFDTGYMKTREQARIRWWQKDMSE